MMNGEQWGLGKLLDSFREPAPLVTVVRLGGVIGAPQRFRQGLSMGGIARDLEAAFRKRRSLAAVALLINSPGGSPVQSHLIFKRIRALAAERKVPVLAFCEDAAASGGYMLACAADEIFVDPSTIVGSIGVVYAGFGFPELIAKAGIERRVHTAGESKAMLDPFKPEDPADIQHLQSLQADIHDMFKALVRDRRAGRLKGAEADLFTGAFWTGSRGVELGLADAIGDLRGVLRARFGERVRVRMMGQGAGMRLRIPVAGRSSVESGGVAELPGSLLQAIEARALWARLGL